MAQLNVNLADVNENDAEGGNFTVLPRGRYMLQIIEGDVKENSKKTGMLFDYKAEVIEGDCQGAKIFGNINVSHSNMTAQKIGQAQLKALALACGMDPSTLSDTEQLNWQPFLADVDIEPYQKNGQDKERNVIKKFIHAGNADSVPPGKEAANDNVTKPTTTANDNKPQTTTARPTQNNAATASGGARSMPWKK
ncbi:DUF669 domain-containing protein [Bradyrhizobium retamae]|uniref:DUF669 domain-containing protein n=1 Tax=Bradyrhizobium retamae TaxID=1300035 RepID=UPI000AA18D94|nr:DUF669 domain-containing protein [Bradyrhizobium retamae]